MNALAGLQQWNHGGDMQNSLMRGMQMGGQMREQREQREREKATDDAFRGMAAGDPNAVNALIATPGMAQQGYQMQQQQMASQQAQQEQADAKQRKQFETIAQLLDGAIDEPSYQQGLAVAGQMGMDVSKAPPNFDPAWVAQQKLFTTTFMNEPQKLTQMAQQLVEAGYDPQTPEFVEQMRQGIAANNTKFITPQPGAGAFAIGPSGEVRTLVAPNDGTQATGAAVGSGPPTAAPTSKAEYDALPPGTRYKAPDGSILTKGGAAKTGGATFPG